ncbi:MAG TPA: putative glycoside hydrolase, partial [Mobilitalea sp.]|nr:putative glycoside hydrolase [Mobilitalea sp.]
MGKKHDMYINYDRSYKKRGRRNSSKVWKVFFAMIVISGFGLGAYFAFGSQLNIVNKNGHSGQNLSQNEGTASNNNQSDTNGKSAKPTITVTPTASPIVSPVTVQNSTGAGSDADQTQPDTRVPVEVKGLYVTGYTAGTSKINDLINIADSTEINALVIDVKNDDGRISYAMDSTTAKQIGAVTNGIADMPALIKQLKEKNIYTIARIVSFKDPLLAEKRQDLALKFSDGSLYRDSKGQCWVNPYKKEVWDYLMEVATQAAAIGFNEIQFDYIRFSTGGDIDKVDFGEEAKTKS